MASLGSKELKALLVSVDHLYQHPVNTFNSLGPIADISVMVSHKLMGIYMVGLMLGVIH